MEFEYALLFIIVLVYLIVSPILLFLPWYTWWNKNDPHRKYSCFRLASMAYYKYNYPLYLLVNILTGPQRFQHDWWVLFLAAIMTGEGKGLVSDNPNEGLCTPKTLCESLIPSEYPITPLPGKYGRNWPENSSEWRGLLTSWMGMSKIPVTEAEYKPNATIWNNAPNNFLKEWGITPYSPIVIGYVTGLSTYQNEPVYSTPMEALLGNPPGGSLGESGGGWWGFLQSGGNFGDRGLDEANRAVWSHEGPPSHIANGQKGKCSGAAVASGAVGMAASGALAGGMLAPESLGLSIPIGALIGALLGSFTGAIGGHCL